MTHVSWQDRLMERYPHLFRVEGVHGRPVRTGYPAVENGWRGLIELVIARIAAVAPREGMWIERMSEKWG
ncbi:MAG: hypothetical protein K2Y05_10455, partial [Hyphomicrobiaceae bacterium]|nr:hypothetical protein [Hyphomicrobiaceae bacterium]